MLEPNGIAVGQVLALQRTAEAMHVIQAALYMRMLSRHVWKISALQTLQLQIVIQQADETSEQELQGSLYDLTCRC